MSATFVQNWVTCLILKKIESKNTQLSTVDHKTEKVHLSFVCFFYWLLICEPVLNYDDSGSVISYITVQ